MEIDIDDIGNDVAAPASNEFNDEIREGEAVDDLTLAARFAVLEGEIGVPIDAMPLLRAAVMPSAPPVNSDDVSDSESDSSEEDAAVEATVEDEPSVAAPDSVDSDNDSQPAKAETSARKKDRPARDEDEEDVGDAPPVRTKNEVPLWQLPIAPLPCLVVDTQAKQLLQAAGAVLHVHEGAGWDFDPLLAIEGGGGASKGRSKGKGKRKGGCGGGGAGQNEGGSGLPSEGTAVVRDEVVTYTLVVQASLPPGTRPLDEKSVLCLPDGRVLGHIEDVFGPVKLPLYLLRVKARTGITKEELQKHGIDALAAAVVGTHASGGTSSLDLLMAGYGSEEEEQEAEQGGGKQIPASSVLTVSGPAETLVRTMDLCPGALLCSLPSHARWIIPEQLLANPWLRGSDASNVYDEEIAPEEQEYSDDEAEQQARARAKALRRRTGAGQEDEEDEEVEPDGALLDAPHAFRKARGGGRGGKGRSAAPRSDGAAPTSAGTSVVSHSAGHGHAPVHAWQPPGSMAYPYPPPPPYAYAYPPQLSAGSASGHAYPAYPFPYTYPYPPRPSSSASDAPQAVTHGASGAMQAQMVAMAALQAQLMSQHGSAQQR